MNRAFSLIETVFAIGLMSFALVGLLGLMPIGLTIFRETMDTTMNTYIVQQVVSDLQQGEFQQLSQAQPMRYFDDQGTQRRTVGESLYSVNTVVQSPSALPGGTSTNLATVTVEIVKNPNRVAVQINPTTQSVLANPGLTVTRFPVFIAAQNE